MDCPKSNFVSEHTIKVAGLDKHGCFFVGGQYVGEKDQEVMRGQMYVEVFVPQKKIHPYPLVFFHGSAQTATNWLQTPDGRAGWMHYFLAKGYVIYLIDQPARGRSAYHPEIDGKYKTFSAATVEKMFTNTKIKGTWKQAEKHTQWPGSGIRGDSAFDEFYASQVGFLASNADTQKLVQHAGAALLDKIGPAILITHSQAGAFGWVIADVRPGLVKGIVALEPYGPPMENAIISTGPARRWGVADIPMTYFPPAVSENEIEIMKVKADKPEYVDGWLQKEPARQLINLHNIPIMIISAEASYHAPYDIWTSRYLKQAGVDNTFVQLADYGIRGNGHMMMLEKNSDEIAAFVEKWIKEIS